MTGWRRGFSFLLATMAMLTFSLASGQDFQSWVRGLHRRNIQVSAGIWDLQSGKMLDGQDVDNLLVPASTTKVVSTYAILKTWKPNHQIETEIWGDLVGTAIQGDLILKGFGDPFLTDERIWLMARSLKQRGILKVSGELRLDQSAFDGQMYEAGWQNTSVDQLPAIAPLSVNFGRDAKGRLVGDPDRLASETIGEIFSGAGILIEGHKGLKSNPRKLLNFPSPPLRNLVDDVNKFSNNFMIEMLTKRFGEGSWARGTRRIMDFYQTVFGLGSQALHITDGSGLSKDNRISAKTLAIVLRAAWHDFEVGPELVASLKVQGGEPFKLKHKDPNLERRLRVKSGHLSGVVALCGYLQTMDGKERVFAILLNGPASDEDIWEQVSRWAN